MLSSFSITSFRGIDYLPLIFGKRTYIQGANGSGKTHILDAIHLLSGSRPLYGSSDIPVGCVFDGVFSVDGLSKNYKLIRDNTKEFFALQGVKITRPKYMNALPWRTVYISPFDMNLLYFAPSMRRDAMDTILARVYEQFGSVRRDYDMIMRQRNALLKKIREGESKRDELNFWDTKFAEIADLYGMYRKKYIEFIQSQLHVTSSHFSKHPLMFFYESSVANARIEGGILTLSDQDVISRYLSTNRERDIITGHTHIGPHRDDWGFRVMQDERGTMKNVDSQLFVPQNKTIADIIPAESFLSRGEMKMVLLGLKVMEAEFITQILGIPVIILIDDIFAELDEENSDLFLDSLRTYQVILTSQKPIQNHEKHHDFICINLQYS